MRKYKYIMLLCGCKSIVSYECKYIMLCCYKSIVPCKCKYIMLRCSEAPFCSISCRRCFSLCFRSVVQNWLGITGRQLEEIAWELIDAKTRVYGVGLYS